MSDVKTKAREERLKQALRDNLRRRKAQARGRESATESGEGGPSDPARPDEAPGGASTRAADGGDATRT